MQGLDTEKFLRVVWTHQYMPALGGVAAIAHKADEELWDEDWYPIDDFSVPFNPGFGSYFCPNLFVHRRRKDQCLPGAWLYQDLDEVSPSACSIPPTLWWETSPGRYQALWKLSRHLHPQGLADLNKALNRSCRADPGTWNLTRMLRIPGSWNGKRECFVSPAYRFARVKPGDLVPA